MKRSHWRCLLAIVCAISLIMTMSGMTAFADEIDGEDSFIADVGTEVIIQEENEMVSDSENNESEVSDTSVIDDSEMPENEQGENIDSSGESDTAESGEDVVNEDPTAVEAEEALPENLVGASNQAAMWFMDDLWITQLPGVGSHYGTNNFDVIGSQNNNIKAPFDCTIVDIIEGYQAGNTVIIQSLSPVRYANGNEDYMSMAFGHDNDISDCYVGRTLVQGEVFYQTGNFGQVTGIHSHVTCMAGKYTDHDRGFQNSGYTYDGSPTYSFANAVHPVDALFISPSTNIVDSQGLVFKVPANTPEPEPHGQTVPVGENVTVGFDSETGTVTFYSQGGTLSKNWSLKGLYEGLHISKGAVKAITISDDSDVMYLPEDSFSLFREFENLESLILSKADTSNVTSMGWMFSDCRTLQTLDISGFDTSNVTDMQYMFWNCSALQSLDVSGFDTSNVTDMSSMFGGCCHLYNLDVSGFDTSNVMDMFQMFCNCSALQTLDVSGFDTSNVTKMYDMFSDCSSLQKLDVSGFDTSNVTDMQYMFWNCSALQSLDVSGFDTSNVTYMDDMFYGCSGLQTLDVSGFDTSNVTRMDDMFYGCSGLQTLDVSGFDTSNVTEMFGMFWDCSSLQTVDVSGFDTSNVTDMRYMFYNCSSLQTVDVSGFDTSNVTEMYAMFEDCSSLQSLDVSGFDTMNVCFVIAMFKNCSGLQILDLSSFDLSGLQNYDPLYPDYRNDTMLEGCGAYIISTPVNVSKIIYLPSTFVDASGTEYDSLPQGLSESIRLTKKGADIPDDRIDIADATVTGIKNKTYTGMAQTQNPTVKLGDVTLTKGTDYTLSYVDNTNAGTATVTITGIGNYTGSLSKTFTINQAAPKLTFASSEVSKTTLDAPFTNELTIKTDGAITFNSTNKSVATVNGSSGRVTIKSAGTTTITVKAAEGTNYKARNAEYTLTVTNGLAIVGISDDCYGKTGTPVSFHVEAAGTGITYQWQYRTAGTTGWRTPSQASAKTADYTFNLKPSYDNIEVRCIVSDDSGNEVISETRKANVFAFTSQPKDTIASAGEVVNFEVSAIGNNVTYQWYYKRPNSTWKKTTVAGATTAVLPITAGTKNGGTSYRCVIIDEAGNKITSSAALLTLNDGSTLGITGISEDAYDVNGESVTFHIDAAGQGDLTYQWQYKLAGETKWRTPAQASAKTADYVFKLKPSYDNIEVRCIVKDATGNSVTSDVRKANVFAITGQPQDAELELGEQTTFAVEAVGKDLAYQWFYMRPEGSWKKVTVAGANTASLVITANTKNDGTKFQCRITDGLGNILVSSAALLTQK